MTEATRDLAIRRLGAEFAGFSFKKNRMSWVRRSADNVLSLIGYQASNFSDSFYLNFGAYFANVTPIANTPKLSDWHLTARYERFSNLSDSERSRLFSLEENNFDTLEQRCAEIAGFARDHILPGLLNFGDYGYMHRQISESGANVFEPYWVQHIRTHDLCEFISSSARNGNNLSP